jgi:hypothetical protein
MGPNVEVLQLLEWRQTWVFRAIVCPKELKHHREKLTEKDSVRPFSAGTNK